MPSFEFHKANFDKLIAQGHAEQAEIELRAMIAAWRDRHPATMSELEEYKARQSGTEFAGSY